jgi:hypothetical protein
MASEKKDFQKIIPLIDEAVIDCKKREKLGIISGI